MSATFLVSIVIGAVAVFARRIEGSWTSPAVFLPAVWAGLVGAFALLFPALDEYYAGSLWILASCVAFLAGSVVAHGQLLVAPRETPRDRIRQRLPLLVPLVVLGNLAGVAEITYLFVRRGASPFSLVDIVTLVTVNRAGNYGWAQLTQRPSEWFAFVALYAGALFGGVLFRLSRQVWERVAAVLAVVFVALVFALYGSRFGALYGGSFWLAAYLSTSSLTSGEGAKDARILLRLGVIAIVILGGASVGTQVLRYWTQLDRIGWRSILADGFSFVGAFSIWFRDHGLIWSDFTWGARTFTKLVAPFGLQEAPLSSIDVDFTYSNIFTVFRDLLEDFGVVGSLVFFALGGFIARATFVALRGGRMGALPLGVLVYTFVLTSFATSVFFYTAPTAALALFAAYIGAASYRPPRRTVAALSRIPT